MLCNEETALENLNGKSHTEEMDQQAKVLAGKAGGLSLIPRTHTVEGEK